MEQIEIEVVMIIDRRNLPEYRFIESTGLFDVADCQEIVDLLKQRNKLEELQAIEECEFGGKDSTEQAHILRLMLCSLNSNQKEILLLELMKLDIDKTLEFLM